MAGECTANSGLNVEPNAEQPSWGNRRSGRELRYGIETEDLTDPNRPVASAWIQLKGACLKYCRQCGGVKRIGPVTPPRWQSNYPPAFFVVWLASNVHTSIPCSEASLRS